jgi:hypothetical protein
MTEQTRLNRRARSISKDARDKRLDICSDPAEAKHSSSNPIAKRLCAIRAELSELLASPIGFGARNGPQRKKRDELILHDFAADAWARLIEARAAQ